MAAVAVARASGMKSGARKRAMARMFNPPHPGEVLQDTVLSAGGLSVTEFAKRLGVSRVALSRVVNGRAAVSAELAIRLATALGGLGRVLAADAGCLRPVARGKEASPKDCTAEPRCISRIRLHQSVRYSGFAKGW